MKGKKVKYKKSTGENIHEAQDPIARWLPMEEEDRTSLRSEPSITLNPDNEYTPGLYSYLADSPDPSNANSTTSSSFPSPPSSLTRISPSQHKNSQNLSPDPWKSSTRGAKNDLDTKLSDANRSEYGFSPIPLSPLAPSLSNYSMTSPKITSNCSKLSPSYGGPGKHHSLIMPEMSTSDIYVTCRKQHDKLFSRIYLLNLFCMLLIGFVNLCISEHSVTSIIPIAKAYKLLSASTGIFFISILVSLGIGVAWTYALHSYCALFVWSIIGVIPVVMALISVSCIYHLSFISSEHYSTTFVLLVLGLSMASLYFFSRYFRKVKERIQVSIRILQVTTQILRDNPSVFFACYGILLGYLIFVGVWILFYTHLFLIGKKTNDTWTLFPGSYVLQAYFLAVFLWTTAVFETFQKDFFGHVVGRWYFQLGGNYSTTFRINSEDLDVSVPEEDLALLYQRKVNIVMESLKLAAFTDFGPICGSASALFVCKGLRLAIKAYYRSKQQLLKLTDNSLNIFLKPLDLSLGIVEHVLSRFTSATIYYVSIRGVSLFQGGRELSNLVRKHFGLFVTSDYLSHGIFFFAALITSLLVGLFIYFFELSESPISSTPTSSLWIFVCMAFPLLRFVTCCVTDIMDAAFVCYILDLENDRKTIEGIHDAFKTMVSTSSQQTPSGYDPSDTGKTFPGVAV